MLMQFMVQEFQLSLGAHEELDSLYSRGLRHDLVST